MKTSLLIGSILFLLLPFTILSFDVSGPGGASSLDYYGFFYAYTEDPATGDTETDTFTFDWLAKDDVYGGYFSEDMWWLGLVAVILAIIALVGAIVEFHRLQGLLLVLAGICVVVGRYFTFDDAGLSYPQDEFDFLTVTMTWLDIPIGFLIGLIFGLVSLRSSD